MNRTQIDNVSWDMPLVNTTMDAKASRIKVTEPFSWRMLGVDGSTEGGLRPFPGFIETHRFDHEAWGTAVLGQHDETSEIIDVRGVNFTISDRWYGFGFVYRVRRKNGSLFSDIFMDYYHTQLGRWVKSVLLMQTVPVGPKQSAILGKPMTVQVQGRNIYVMVKDREPVLAYVRREAPYDLIVVGNTGPGARPALLGPDLAGALGSIASTGDPNRPGAGQLVLLDFLPSEADPLMPYDGTGSVDASGTGYGQDESKLQKLPPGDYAFAYLLYNSETGKRSALSEIADVRKSNFDENPDDDVEPIPLYAAMEITYDSTQYDRAYFYRSVRVQDAGGVYVAGILHLDAIVDLTSVQTANVLSGSLKQAVYWYELSDKQLVFQSTFQDRTLYDADMPKGGAAIWYEGSLIVGAISQSSQSSTGTNTQEDEVRGVGEIRWSSLTEISPELFPPDNRYYPSLQYNEVIAFEKAGPNVIGFSRDRQYMLRREDQYIRVTEMHEGFGVVNSKACETVGSLIYFVTSKGMKNVDSQAQLDEVKSINYIIRETWAADMRAVELVFDPHTSCLYAYNPTRGEACLFWFNTGIVTELRDLPFETGCRAAWPQDFVYDLSDLTTNDGTNNATYRNPLEERAFFVQNAPKDGVSDIVTGFAFRLFTHDVRRERRHRGSKLFNVPCTTLLPCDLDSCFNVSADYSGIGEIALGTTYGETYPSEVWGMRLYVLSSTNPALVHKSAVVKRAAETSGRYVLTDATRANLSGLKAGDIVGFSPVYFEWQGSQLGTKAEDGTPIAESLDYFSVKHVQSLGASFAGVTTPGLADRPAFLNRFRATVYRGTEEQPLVSAFPTDRNGNPTASVVDREGTYHAAFGLTAEAGKHGVSGTALVPGVIIVAPSLDFELLGVRVQGSVLASDRSRKA
ncbi:MAG: hypothetical protein ACK5U7_07515 [Bacteroidota bacterium]